MSRSSSAPADHALGVPVLRVLLFAAAVPALLRRPLAELPRSLEPRQAAPGEPAAAQVAAAAASIDRILRAAWPLVRRGCLIRGLTRYRFLREAGADVALVFGVASGSAGIDGHCWIAYRGEPLAEPRDPRAHYCETWRITPPRDGAARGATAPPGRRVPA